MANRQFIVTNRPYFTKGGREQIDMSDRAINSLNLRFGYYHVSSGEFELIPDVSTHRNRYREVHYHETGRKRKFQGSELWFRDLYSEMAKKPEKNDTLVFIHGFACGFDCLTENLNHLYKTYVQDPDSNIARIAAFSWPANNQLTQYFEDKYDAGYAGIALARSYKKLMQFFEQFFKDERNERCGSNIHLLCHSMGNQVLESMIETLLASSSRYGQVFKEIIMAAPDLDNDVFEKGKPLSHIMDFGERVHVYIHRRDKALVVSNLTKNFKSRLGRSGPADPFVIPSNVNIVDASAISDQTTAKEKLVDHWYYKKSDTAAKDIGEVLNGVPDSKFRNRDPERTHNNFYLLKP